MLTQIDKQKKATGKFCYFAAAFLGLVLMSIWCTFVNAKLFSDFEYYYNLAVQISSGGPWGDTYTTVGYSILLGFLIKIFGADPIVGKVFNIVLMLINYYMVYSILSKIDINERLRKIIFILFIIFPLNIVYSNLLCTEVLFTTILLIVTSLYFSNMKYKYVYIGILVGLNAMVKPFFVIYFFAIFIIDSISLKNVKKGILNGMIVLILALITIAPWVYRNTKLMGQLTFVSNNGGIVMYINNNSQNKTGRWMAAQDVENSIVKTEEYKKANMTQKNKMLSKAAKQWIRKNPKRFVELGFLRLKTTYDNASDIYYTTYESGLSDKQKFDICTVATVFKVIFFYPGILFILIYSVYILLCLFKNKFENINKNLLYSTIMFYMFTCVYFMTEGQQRYSFPLIFFMIYVTCHILSYNKCIIRRC